MLFHIGTEPCPGLCYTQPVSSPGNKLKMAEGGYSEGILDFELDITNFVMGGQQEINQDNEVKVNSGKTDDNSSGSERKKDEKDSLLDHLTNQLEAFSVPKQHIEKQIIPPFDLERANRDLDAVKKEHMKLVDEKNALIQALKAGTDKVEVVIADTLELERSRDVLQGQVEATYAQVQVESAAIAELKEAGKKDLAESECLKEQSRLLNIELERNVMLEMKKESMIKILYSEVATKKVIVSNLLREKELNDEEAKMDEVMEEAEQFHEFQKEVTDEELALQRKIEEDLRVTKVQVIAMEQRNSDLNDTVLTKEKEIQSMTSRLKDVRALKEKQTKQLEELQSHFDKLGEQTALERNRKHRDLHTPEIEQMVNESREANTAKVNAITDISQLKDAMKDSNASHEGTLSLIRQHHSEILSDFDKQMQAVKRTKPKQAKKANAKKNNPKK